MKNHVRNIVFAALCLAIGIIIPNYFHMLGSGSGSVFLPLHIPVLICGLICGWKYGGIVGAVLPLICSALTGMPSIYPVAIAMMFELCAYGTISGLLHKKYNVYISLLGAMFGGRIVSGCVYTVLLGFAGKSYSFTAFIISAFVTALPGIAIQILFIPVLVKVLTQAKIIAKPNV